MAESWNPSSTTSCNTNDLCSLEDGEDFKLVSLGNEHFDKVIELLSQYFVPFEAINLGLGCTFQDRKEFMERNVRQYLNGGLSIGTFNNLDKLVGVSLHAIEKSSKLVEKSDPKVSVEGNSMVKHTVEVLMHMTNNYNVFQNQGVNEVLYNAIDCVHPEYGCRGINKKMKVKVEQIAMERGIRVAYSIATGIRSQASLQKIGYMTVYETEYKNFGFLNLKAMGDNICIKLMVKRLV